MPIQSALTSKAILEHATASAPVVPLMMILPVVHRAAVASRGSEAIVALVVRENESLAWLIGRSEQASVASVDMVITKARVARAKVKVKTLNRTSANVIVIVRHPAKVKVREKAKAKEAKAIRHTVERAGNVEAPDAPERPASEVATATKVRVKEKEKEKAKAKAKARATEKEAKAIRHIVEKAANAEVLDAPERPASEVASATKVWVRVRVRVRVKEKAKEKARERERERVKAKAKVTVRRRQAKEAKAIRHIVEKAANAEVLDAPERPASEVATATKVRVKEKAKAKARERVKEKAKAKVRATEKEAKAIRHIVEKAANAEVLDAPERPASEVATATTVRVKEKEKVKATEKEARAIRHIVEKAANAVAPDATERPASEVATATKVRVKEKAKARERAQENAKARERERVKKKVKVRATEKDMKAIRHIAGKAANAEVLDAPERPASEVATATKLRVKEKAKVKVTVKEKRVKVTAANKGKATPPTVERLVNEESPVALERPASEVGTAVMVKATAKERATVRVSHIRTHTTIQVPPTRLHRARVKEAVLGKERQASGFVKTPRNGATAKASGKSNRHSFQDRSSMISRDDTKLPNYSSMYIYC